MESLSSYQFSLPQILIILGVAQSVYALVYISLRVVKTSLIMVPAAYYFILAGCFLFDFGATMSKDAKELLEPLGFGFWALLPSISYLLVIQLTVLKRPPAFGHFAALMAPVVTAGVAFAMGMMKGHDLSLPERLMITGDWIDILTVISGGVLLLAIWFQRDQMETIFADKALGRPRYWVIICIVIMNVALLATGSMSMSGVISMPQTILIRTILGISFVYLAATSLFRIYPLALSVIKEKKLTPEGLDISEDDRRLIEKLQNLLNVEKVYQEPEYSRASFAAELGVSEAIVSRLANEYLQKTIPQLLNEYRVEDAKILLQETTAPIQIVAKEAGFPSLATFNRVFRDLAGQTPSDYRKEATPQFVKLTG